MDICVAITMEIPSSPNERCSQDHFFPSLTSWEENLTNFS